MKIFTATPQEFQSGAASIRAVDLFKNRGAKKRTRPRPPAALKGPSQGAQVGTITPEEFQMGRPWWGHRAYGHRSGPVYGMKPESFSPVQLVVNTLLETGIEQQLKAKAKTIRHCGDYGMLFYNPKTHEVHWTAGDADGEPDFTGTDEIKKMLHLPGIKHVEIGDEWSPSEEEGWQRLKFED